MNADEAWSRLATYVRARRTERRMSQAQLGAASGTSETTVRHLEGKVRQTFSAETLQAICRALGWTSDSADRIMHGDEPEDTFAVSFIPSVPATNHDQLTGRTAEVQHRQPTNVAPSPEWEARFRAMQAEIRRIRDEQRRARIDELEHELATVRQQQAEMQAEIDRLKARRSNGLDAELPDSIFPEPDEPEEDKPESA